VQMLLAAGADKDKAGDDGRTPLMWTAMKGHVKVVQMLQCDSN